jgi:hypothetical protein
MPLTWDTTGVCQSCGSRYSRLHMRMRRLFSPSNFWGAPAAAFLTRSGHLECL